MQNVTERSDKVKKWVVNDLKLSTGKGKSHEKYRKTLHGKVQDTDQKLNPFLSQERSLR